MSGVAWLGKRACAYACLDALTSLVSITDHMVFLVCVAFADEILAAFFKHSSLLSFFKKKIEKMESKYAAHDALTPGPPRTDFQLFLYESGCCASRGARQFSPLGPLEFDEHMTTVATATATKIPPLDPLLTAQRQPGVSGNRKISLTVWTGKWRGEREEKMDSRVSFMDKMNHPHTCGALDLYYL